LPERTNDEWIEALSGPGPEREAALGDLRALLVRGLRYVLAQYANVGEADIEDFVQEALLKVLSGLDSFRGESHFTTWTQKIAVHVAFTDLRRHRWRNVSLDQVTALPQGEPGAATILNPPAGPEKLAIRREVLSTMRQVIAEELTDRQRQAFVAVRLHGMPMDEVARRMNTNRNALYKLLFDARQRLKQRMLARGLSAEDILSAFES
jgi:RNA polymerase sigma-70 factor (ECF subfamily)